VGVEPRLLEQRGAGEARVLRWVEQAEPGEETAFAEQGGVVLAEVGEFGVDLGVGEAVDQLAADDDMGGLAVDAATKLATGGTLTLSRRGTVVLHSHAKIVPT
jgi:hypothetical protein